MAANGADRPSMTVAKAAESGSQRDLLVAIRSRVAVAVDDPDTPTRDLAALTKRLVDVARGIELIDGREEEKSGPTPDEELDPDSL